MFKNLPGKIRVVCLFAITVLIQTAILISSDKEQKNDDKGDLKFSILWYLANETELRTEGDPINKFQINRAYLTGKKSLADIFDARITLDAYQEKTTGDFKVRLKYLFSDFSLPEFIFFTKPHVEVGLVHTPWLDFEEHVNFYRMQGTMFSERADLFNSADLGLSFMALIGGEMDKEYKDNFNKNYPGKYGSIAFGVYNGGGYHALESNNNKSLQGRLTLRPLPYIIPGFQMSYFGTLGTGNKVDSLNNSPDWQTNIVMVSLEYEYFTLTGQYLFGKGNQKGSMVVINSDAVKYNGFSVFIEGKIINNLKLIGRYDNLDPNINFPNDKYSRIIAGVGYDFGKQNILILDFDKKIYENKNFEIVNLLKLTMQVNL